MLKYEQNRVGFKILYCPNCGRAVYYSYSSYKVCTTCGYDLNGCILPSVSANARKIYHRNGKKC